MKICRQFAKVWIFCTFVFVALKLQEMCARARRSSPANEVNKVVSVKGAGTEDNDKRTIFQEDDNAVVFYNRVPKTGSTTFANIIFDVSARNKFYVYNFKMLNYKSVLSIQDQYKLVQNISNWRNRRPAFFHGHAAYIDFKKFSSPTSPLYINIIRDPLERLVSHYYFLRYGDDYQVGIQRSRHGDVTTFDECVNNRGKDCSFLKLWRQIPFFCGHAAECWKVGSKWALEEGKRNLVNHYLLVGLTEQMEEFLVVLESVFPRMFHGIVSQYRTGGKSHIRKTLYKKTILNETFAKFRASNIWKMEMEFYNFAKNQFEFVKNRSTFSTPDGVLHPIPKQYHYGKSSAPGGIRKLSV